MLMTRPPFPPPGVPIYSRASFVPTITAFYNKYQVWNNEYDIAQIESSLNMSLRLTYTA